MANILVVDKDAALLQWLQQKLPSQNPEFEVIPVKNVKEAIRNLEAENVDLVITELDLPEINGFELLAFINKHFSYLPVIVTSDQKPGEGEVFPEDHAIFQYLAKPFDPEGLARRISAGLASKVNQSLREVFLLCFLVLVAQQKRSYALIVRSKNQTGSLYFNKGELFEAETEKYTGLEAALEIISWKAAEVIIDFETVKQEKKIDFDLREILFPKPKTEPAPKEPNRQAAGEKEHQSGPVRKEPRIDIKKIQAGIKNLLDDLGDGLLATDFWAAADGQSLAGYRSQPKAVALFNKLTDGLRKALKVAGLSGVGRYYLIELEDSKYIIVLPLNQYQWSIFADGQKVQLGMLLNIAIPHIFEAFNAALKES